MCLFKVNFQLFFLIAPAEFDHPTVLSKTPYSLYISWDPPTSPNGLILNYTIELSGSVIVDTLLVNSGTQLVYNITQLSPYTEYSFSVTACNSAGCIVSPFFQDITGEAGKTNTILSYHFISFLLPLAPLNVPPPTLVATTTGFVIITWSEPGQPNGVITEYMIYKALLNSSFSSLATVESNETLYYEDSDVVPYTRYQYYIEATNNAGSTAGQPRTVTTAEAG